MIEQVEKLVQVLEGFKLKSWFCWQELKAIGVVHV